MSTEEKLNIEEKILKKFHGQIMDFFDDLMSLFEGHEEYSSNITDIMMIKIVINNDGMIKRMMNAFVESLLPLKHIVKNRDDDFFLSDKAASLFLPFNKTKVNKFKEIWQSDLMTPESRETIWKWFDVFILLADRYFIQINSQKEL